MSTMFHGVDAKLEVLAYLKTRVGFPVVSTRPDKADAPKQFVRLITTGGGGRTSRILQDALVTVDSYAETSARSMRLALNVDALIHQMPTISGHIVQVRGSYPSEFPDPETGQARCTATYQFTVKIPQATN